MYFCSNMACLNHLDIRLPYQNSSNSNFTLSYSYQKFTLILCSKKFLKILITDKFHELNFEIY